MATKSVYYCQIRTTDSFGDMSTRDWVHEDTEWQGYATFAEAQAALVPEVEDYLSAYLLEDEGKPVWKKVQDYSESEGGGFWFEGESGGEGRAMVRKISFDDGKGE